MMTEKSKITVKFSIHELLHIHDQLIISRDHFDTENEQLCDYLCYRINEQIPDFTESEDYYKPIIPGSYDKN